MTTDLTDWNERFDYARACARKGGRPPNDDHATLLRNAYWDWNDCEFGAPSMDPKRPYGNSDVENDLAKLLPHLSEQDRIRTHCELSAVLLWMARNA